MKKIIIAMAAVAAAFTTASCSKEQPVSANENPTVGKSVITASIENGLTKAHLDENGNDTDGYKVFWSEGDDLIVGGGLDEYGNYLNWVAEYKLEDSSAGSSKGTFSWQAGNTFISIDEICQEPSFEAGNMYMAVHPFDLIDMNTSAFTWRTEQTYNGTTGYIPMIAAAEGTEDGTADFKFTNLGGLLRLTVKGTATIKSIIVKAKEPMSGEIDCFAMDEEGNIVALMGNDDRYETYNYINLDCGENGVALSSTGTDFYISMPCHYSVSGDDISLGGYSEVTITLTDMKDNICEKNLSSNKQLVIERSKITIAKFTASEFKAPVPEGALPGKFSVSADKQVYFSQGNLYYDGSEFQFEANQDDYPTTWSASHVGHFYWSKTAEEAVKEVFNWSQEVSTDDVFFTNATETTAKPDFTVNGMAGKYRTLSMEEWEYLLNSRTVNGGTGEGQSFSYITYNNKLGFVLYPDNYTGSVLSETVETLPQGVVFLPNAGGRGNSNVDWFKTEGNYWSSSKPVFSENISSWAAYKVTMIEDWLYISKEYDDAVYLDYGSSIRLVTDVK